MTVLPDAVHFLNTLFVYSVNCCTATKSCILIIMPEITHYYFSCDIPTFLINYVPSVNMVDLKWRST